MLADTITPVAAYLRLRDHYRNCQLLESNEYGQRENSYSYICCNPVASLIAGEDSVKVSQPDGNEEITDLTPGNPGRFLKVMGDFARSFGQGADEYPFSSNGLFGYLTYDAVQHFEKIRFKEAKNEIPLARYDAYEFVIVIDHYHNRIHLFHHEYEGHNSQNTLDELLSHLTREDSAVFAFAKAKKESASLTDVEFKDMVSKAKQHCQQGEVFQIVISKKFSQPFTGDDFQVYRSLRSINPSPYLFYFDYGDYRIMGSSPEAQLRIAGEKATIQPIAGTYKRTGDDAQDNTLAEHLKQDPKENAEHVMLVDLARNDLSRHAKNVHVENYQQIQRYSHVLHMVSQVSGTVSEKNRLPLVGDTFPAGTLSGAPKYRAMQLIDQMEPDRRSFYGGAIGFLGFDGSFNHAILIRSALSKDHTLYYRAGAGVVVDSNEENENQEVYNKIGAVRKAIDHATKL